MCRVCTLPDRNPAQRDVLVGQQPAGFGQLHGHPVGRRERVHPQRAERTGRRSATTKVSDQRSQPTTTLGAGARRTCDQRRRSRRSWLRSRRALRRRPGHAGTISPGSVGLGAPAPAGRPGPARRCAAAAASSVYFNEPTNWCQLYRFGPCSPTSPSKPMSGIDPRTSRSTLTRVEMALLEVDFTNGGISRFSAARVASGRQRHVVPRPGDACSASAITLRPLVSVPAIDGNFASCLLVSPTCRDQVGELGGVGGQRVGGRAGRRPSPR